MNEGYKAKEIRVKNGKFCRIENFCPQLGVSNNIHGTVYTNNSPAGVLTTGGQTPQTRVYRFTQK